MGNINLNINNRIERFDEKDVEYKVNYSRRIIIRLILSFLNTDGGMIYIGGTENEYMLELDFAKRTKIDIINTIKNIRPVATNLININIDKRSGKAIVIVNVNKGIHAYYLISENPIYYIRQNGQTSTTTQHKLLRQSHPNEISVYHPEEYKPKNNVFYKKIIQITTSNNVKYFKIGASPSGNSFYKYMDLESALLCLQNNNIRFVEPTLWMDLYEGRFYSANYNHVQLSPHKYDPFLLACCFTYKANNEAAWKLYTYGKQGLGARCVEFQINRFKLRMQLSKFSDSKIYECNVRYYPEYDVNNFHKKNISTKDKQTILNNEYLKFFNPFNKDSYLNLLSIKRDAFEHEKEIRILIEPNDQKPKAKKRIRKGQTIYGTDQYINLDWINILESIRIDDSCSEIEYRMLENKINELIDASSLGARDKSKFKKKLRPTRYPIYGKRKFVTIEG